MTDLKLLYNSCISGPNGEIQEMTWLNGRSFSEAFVICVGAGPWKFARRKSIQQQALNKLSGRDLSDLSVEECDKFYPLSWQNKFLLNMRNESFFWKNAEVKTSFGTRKLPYHSFNEYWERYKTLVNPLVIRKVCENFYNFCKAKDGTKVLSLFLRDSIKFDYCFPIDRHVERFLINHNLPKTEYEMINLCLQNKINPRLLAIGIARKLGIDNPDWNV